MILIRDDKYTIKSLERALDVMMLFYKEKRELGVSEIAEYLGMYKSTVHRILTTLERRGFIQKNSRNNKYWLGIKVFSLGMLYAKEMKLRDIARPHLSRLAEKFKETTHLAVIDFNREEGPEVVVLEKIQKAQFLSMTPPVGSSSPAYCSAMGKILLAYSDPETVEKILKKPLKRYTQNTITDYNKLLKELKKIRQQGYAVDNEELEVGLTCFAAPVYDFENKVIASISLSGPSARLESLKARDVIREVQKTAEEISENLK